MLKPASNRKDITGHVFGQITVKNYSHTIGKKAYWACVCSCGKDIVVHGISLRSGNTKSCGHDRYKNAVAASKAVSTKHGMEGTPTYRSWKAMKERCLKHSHKSYHSYKDKEICIQWINSFESFLSDMGERPDGTSLDRIDNNKGYCKENCRWATPKEQSRNRKNTIHLEINGVTKTLPEWAEIYGINQNTIRCRIKRGVSALDAVSKTTLRVAEWSKA